MGLLKMGVSPLPTAAPKGCSEVPYGSLSEGDVLCVCGCSPALRCRIPRGQQPCHLEEPVLSCVVLRSGETRLLPCCRQMFNSRRTACLVPVPGARLLSCCSCRWLGGAGAFSCLGTCSSCVTEQLAKSFTLGHA